LGKERSVTIAQKTNVAPQYGEKLAFRGEIFALSTEKSPSPGSKACPSQNIHRHLSSNNATALPFALSLLTNTTKSPTTVSSCFFLQSITFADANVASSASTAASKCS
jgi:hypothetical protein